MTAAVQTGANECAKGGKGGAAVWLARISVAGYSPGVCGYLFGASVSQRWGIQPRRDYCAAFASEADALAAAGECADDFADLVGVRAVALSPVRVSAAHRGECWRRLARRCWLRLRGVRQGGRA